MSNCTNKLSADTTRAAEQPSKKQGTEINQKRSRDQYIGLGYNHHIRWALIEVSTTFNNPHCRCRHFVVVGTHRTLYLLVVGMSFGAKTDHLTDGSTSGEDCSNDAEAEAGEEEGGEEVGESFIFCCTCDTET